MGFFVSVNQKNDALPHYAFDASKQLAFTVTQAMHDSEDMATIVSALGKSTRGSKYERRNEQAEVKRTTQSHKRIGARSFFRILHNLNHFFDSDRVV